MADNNDLVSEMVFTSEGVDIHLVSYEHNRDLFGMYVSTDRQSGALICQFDQLAGLEAVIAFIMALQNSNPTAASQRVQDLLATISLEEPELDSQ